MVKNLKSKSKTMHMKITKDLTVNLDDRRSVNFIRGAYPKMPRELAEAAIIANCGTEIEKE